MKTLVLLALPGVVAALLAAQAFRGGITPHVDEVAWIGSAYYFELLRQGAVRHPDWQLLPAREGPPVGRYVFGFALRVAGHPVTTIEPLARWYQQWQAVPGAWGTGRDHADRAAVARRARPTTSPATTDGQSGPVDAPTLATARLVAAAFGVAAAVMVALLGHVCRGPAAGAVAGTLLAVHPVAREAATHALFDGLSLTFSCAAVLALLSLTSAPGPARRRCAVLVTGGLTGLAIATKLNAATVALLMLVAMLVLVAGPRRRGGAHSTARARDVGASLLLAALVFVAVNPTLYPDVPGGLVESFAVPMRTTALQASFLPGHLTSLADKLGAIGDLLCGSRFGLVVLLAVAATVSLRAATGDAPSAWLAGWWWIALCATAAWIPFGWPRYVLPLVPPAALMVGIAVVDMVAWLQTARTHGSPGPTEPASVRGA